MNVLNISEIPKADFTVKKMVQSYTAILIQFRLHRAEKYGGRAILLFLP